MNKWISSKIVLWSLAVAGGFAGFLPIVAKAEHLFRCHHCGKGHAQSHHLVEKTIMVPKKVIELQGKNCVVTKTEEREEKYTVFVMKPEKREFKKECWYLDDEVKSQTITKIEPKLVKVPVKRTNHVKIPYRVLTEEERCHTECTECGPVCVCEKCPVEKTYLQDGISLQNYCETQLVFEKTTKDIFYCVKTPKSFKIPCAEEEYYSLVPEERTRKVTVCVPKIEKQTVEVEVTRMVPCKILVCEACSHK